jgi:Domain of unknown function (DUF4263)
MSALSNHEEIKRDLVHTVRKTYSQQGVPMLVSTVVVHPGPKAWKTVSLLMFLDENTGEVRRRELKTQTWNLIPRSQGGRYEFTQDEYHWACSGDEIEAVRAFLNEEFYEPGTYRLIKRGTELADLLEQLEHDEIASADFAKLIQEAGRDPAVVANLALSTNGTLLAEAVELQRRRSQLDELRRIVENPTSNERDDIHPQLKNMVWIFGGRYIGESRRRQLTTGDVLDIPLLRPDGSLHVVELKGANIPSLVHRYRGPSEPLVTTIGREEMPLIVGTAVHEAVGQAMNYLCHLDEDRDHILTKFKIETRRASATVLIGHPRFVQGNLSQQEIASTLRTYNSHLSRIEVVHYDDLLDHGERYLALAASAPDDQQFEDDAPTDGDPWAEVQADPWSAEPPF